MTWRHCQELDLGDLGESVIARAMREAGLDPDPRGAGGGLRTVLGAEADEAFAVAAAVSVSAAPGAQVQASGRMPKRLALPSKAQAYHIEPGSTYSTCAPSAPRLAQTDVIWQEEQAAAPHEGSGSHLALWPWVAWRAGMTFVKPFDVMQPVLAAGTAQHAQVVVSRSCHGMLSSDIFAIGAVVVTHGSAVGDVCCSTAM